MGCDFGCWLLRVSVRVLSASARGVAGRGAHYAGQRVARGAGGEQWDVVVSDAPCGVRPVAAGGCILAM